MENRDVQFMRLALEEARLALAEDELPVGAIVAIGDDVWGKGHRTKDGNTRLDHGEMRALREALDKDHSLANTMTIYTTLEPCAMCFGAILNSRIKRVVYALEDPYGGSTHFRPEHMAERHRTKFPEITGGVLREEVQILFRTFFQTTKNSYWGSHPENPLVKMCVSQHSHDIGK